MALGLDGIFDRPEVWLLVVKLHHLEDTLHPSRGRGVPLHLLVPPGEVGPVQELGQLLLGEDLTLVLVGGAHLSHVVLTVQQREQLLGTDGLQAGLHVLGPGLELAPEHETF